MLLALLGVVVAAVAALIVWGFNPWGRWRLRHLPGPPPDWLLGNMRQLGQFGKSHEQHLRWARQYGPVFIYWLGRQACVVISDPELVRQVAVKGFMRFHDRPRPALDIGSFADRLFQSSGILFAAGKYWLGIRTACEPLFHSTALASYAPMMNAAADQLLAKLQAAAGSGEGVNVSNLLKEMSLDVIGTTAFGVDFGAQKEGVNSKLVEASEAMFKPTGGMPLWSVFLSFAAPRLRAVWYRLSVLQGGAIRHTMASRRYLWGASQALLDSARRQPTGAASAGAANGNGSSSSSVHANGSSGSAASGLHNASLAEVFKAPDESAAFRQAYQAFAGREPPQSSIVSRLKDAVNKQTGLPLTDLDICAQLFTFLLAGYETTSLALSFTLYELARNPHCQQRIMQEVDAFGRGRPIGYDDLAQFPYTEAAFLEAMRLYPPVSALIALVRLPKKGGAELTLSVGKDGSGEGESGGDTTYHIPEGCRVMLNIWSIHHDPKYWQDPWQYRPERFLAGSAEAAARHPCAFFPFGLGPRKCVGYRFALEEGVLCLARLLQRFELRLDQQHHAGPLDLRTSVTLIPQGGIWLRVHSREQAQQEHEQQQLDTALA